MKPVVMMLGVFHFRFLDDILTPGRQMEIQEVVKRLKAFRPTKVAVEVVVERDEALNSDYRKFLEGDFELTCNEVHQLGFRVARGLRHEKVYATDWMQMEESEKEFLERGIEIAEKQYPDLVKEAEEFGVRIKKYMTPGTILEMMRTHNQEELNILDHQYYIRYRARLGAFPDYIGTFWLRWWYRRNLIIYSNVAGLATEAHDRVLVIYGSGHNYLVKQFLRESGLVELQEPGQYLQ